MTTGVRIAATMAMLAMIAGGCADEGASGPGGPSTPSVSAAPADGTISTDDYSYAVPPGWEEPAQDAPGFAPDSLAGDTNDDDGFTDNVNVVRTEPSPVDTVDDLETASINELKAAQAKDPQKRDRVDIDGDEAIHLTSGFSINDTEYTVEQFATLHDDVVYVVTFSFSTDVAGADRDELASSVLASWQWKS